MDILISQTTKEERQRIVNKAIALGSLDCPPPSEQLQKLFQEYIDGKKEIEEIQKIVGILN